LPDLGDSIPRDFAFPNRDDGWLLDNSGRVFSCRARQFRLSTRLEGCREIIAVSEARAYARTIQALWVTRDGGARWEKLALPAQISAASLSAVSVSGLGGKLWVAAATRGSAMPPPNASRDQRISAAASAAFATLFSSPNDGQSWTRSSWQTSTPALAHRLHTPASGPWILATEARIWRSKDAGHSWTPSSPTPGCVSRIHSERDTQFSQPVIASHANHRVAIAYANGNLLLSADGASSWCQPVAQPPLPPGAGFRSLAFSPRGSLFAVTTDHVLLTTPDFGRSWRTVPLPSPAVALHNSGAHLMLLSATQISLLR
jgi:photosystem II stability/assembly factor-like uncharacterized protein